jgi:hypothetical protein
MSKLSKEDEAIYMAAFGKSKAKTVKERMAAGDAAVAASKAQPTKILKTLAQKRVDNIEAAIDGGIKDGSR